MSTESSREPQAQTLSAPASAGPVEKLAEAIVRSQHNYRELIDNLDQALFTLTLDGEVRVANLRLAEILKTTFQDLIGRPLGDFIESPTLADARRALPHLLKTGVWSGIIPIRLKKDQALCFFDCWLQTATEGGVTSVTGWARDVTKQQESEIRFRDLFETFSEGILLVTPEGQLLDANPALVRILGYGSKEELQAFNFRHHHDDISARTAMLQDLESKGVMHEREIVMRRKDGKRIHCLTSATVIRDAAGKTARYQGTLVDITERREIERRLHQEQEFVRRLIECFPDIIGAVDREGRYTFVSERVKDILGFAPEQLLGQKVGVKIHPEDKAGITEMIQELVSGRQRYAQLESRAEHADGSTKILLANASPLFDEKGEITGAVASVRDVTESKAVEQQLAQRQKFAAMGQMMAGAAHELNNPLTAILGVSDLLRERAADDPTRRQVDLILQQARRAAVIVQNLLAFSRPPAQGRAQLELEAILKEAMQLERMNLEKMNIALKFTAEPGLPLVDGDRKQLLQVFSNILINAEQSISRAGESGEIEIVLAREGGRIRTTISDSGPGIPPGIIGKVFDPFFTTKRPGGGSGLGLTICLAVVKELGGTIEAESPAGAGARIHVLLPAASEARPSTAQPSATARPSRALAGSTALRGHSVLIVDDEESIREIVQEGLTGRGMTVHAAESAEAALALLATNPCEAILCDLNLPGMNGDKLLEKLQKGSADSPQHFVFMTGEFVDPEVAARFGARGVQILQKPFQLSALVLLLAEMLQPQPSQAS